MPIFTPLKATITGAIILVVLIIAGLIYWRGSSNATTKADLRQARETIKVERETKKVEAQTDTRVNAEGIQTATKAQEAVREIERIRETTRQVGTAPLVVGGSSGDRRGDSAGSMGDVECDAACARIMQLAREAREAAIESSAKLQSARASTR